MSTPQIPEKVHGTKAVLDVAQTPHCRSWPPLRYYARTMLSTLQSLLRGRKLEEVPEVLAASAAAALADALPEIEESTAWRTLGWLSAGLGAVAIGLFVGRELRQRYKFNRRTPYDFYAHSGDEMHDMEFGVGI
jgi:hypothetical protein